MWGKGVRRFEKERNAGQTLPRIRDGERDYRFENLFRNELFEIRFHYRFEELYFAEIIFPSRLDVLIDLEF